jgi:competence protein ComEA
MNGRPVGVRGDVLRRIAAACALAGALALPLAAAAADGTRIDLNSATLEQLEALPGVGPSKATAIVEERKKQRFSSVDDLERVKGIGPSVMAQVRDHVTVAGESAK